MNEMDYELRSANYWCGDETFTMKFDSMVAMVEGQHDGECWHWIVKLKDGKFAYCVGWCGYTGWDCQGSLQIEYVETIDQALALCDDDQVENELTIQIVAGYKLGFLEQFEQNEDVKYPSL